MLRWGNISKCKTLNSFLGWIYCERYHVHPSAYEIYHISVCHFTPTFYVCLIMPPRSKIGGRFVYVLSVIMSLCPPLRNFNLANNFYIIIKYNTYNYVHIYNALKYIEDFWIMFLFIRDFMKLCIIVFQMHLHVLSPLCPNICKLRELKCINMIYNCTRVVIFDLFCWDNKIELGILSHSE